MRLLLFSLSKLGCQHRYASTVARRGCLSAGVLQLTMIYNRDRDAIESWFSSTASNINHAIIMSTQRQPATNLNEHVLSQGLPYLDNLVHSKTVENYYLEFKTAAEQDYTGRRNLPNDDRKNYAKAISAFGNSEGGVIIWGIKTGSSDADYADAKEPIKGVSNFRSLLEGFTSTLTVPPHPEVSHEIIFETKKRDEGYIVTRIPKSYMRPFQVVHGKDHRYYIRAGSSSHPAPDTFLRTLFGREPRPDVFAAWGAMPTQEKDFVTRLEMRMLLHNRGEAVAEKVNGYVAIGGEEMSVGINPNCRNSFLYTKNTLTASKIGFVAKPDFLLGIEQEIHPLTVYIDLKKPVGPKGLWMKVLINANNQASYRSEQTTSRKTIEKALDEFSSKPNYSNYDLAKAIFPVDSQGVS